jgi:hypothetical protein
MPAEGVLMTKLGGVVRVLKKEQDRLTKELRGIGAALAAFGTAYGQRTRTRSRMSAAGRARIAAAQRTRWAKLKAKPRKQNPESKTAKPRKQNVVTMPKKRTMSAAARKRIAVAQRARWAKVKAAKKTAKA